jgi:hypothetical protein
VKLMSCRLGFTFETQPLDTHLYGRTESPMEHENNDKATGRMIMRLQQSMENVPTFEKGRSDLDQDWSSFCDVAAKDPQALLVLDQLCHEMEDKRTGLRLGQRGFGFLKAFSQLVRREILIRAVGSAHSLSEVIQMQIDEDDTPPDMDDII